MAKALFISVKDLKRYSALSGNTDPDKLVQFASIAHDIHIETYLGTKLFDRLRAGIISDDLTATETALIDDYIKPMAIHWCLVEVMGFAAYTVTNKGVYKHFSENSETVTKEEVDWIVQKHRNLAESYTNRFQDYMCYNGSDFDEWDDNTEADIKPSNNSYFSGWVL